MAKVAAEITFEVTFEVDDDVWKESYENKVQENLAVFFAMWAHPSRKILSESPSNAVVLEADDEIIPYREDDSEEVKQEAERTPCPKCGKLPEVQQHCEGLGVTHRCGGKNRLHLSAAKDEVVFQGYAPDWIKCVKQLKGDN